MENRKSGERHWRPHTLPRQIGHGYRSPSKPDRPADAAPDRSSGASTRFGGRRRRRCARRAVRDISSTAEPTTTRAAECTPAARAANWRGDNALKAMYLAPAQQWLEIAEIGDGADQERALETRCDGLEAR
jgi:hypothetical protein